MLNRKRKKQILYDTEGTDLVRPDLNKPTDQPVIPIPITPIDPIIPSAKVPSAKGEIPTQNKANLRPGGFDPFYRYIETVFRPATVQDIRVSRLQYIPVPDSAIPDKKVT